MEEPKAIDQVKGGEYLHPSWMMRKAVKRMKDAGDDKVFAIEGTDAATFADLSTDGVHLDSAGADAVAKRLIERMSL